jgi:hypothetical protein
MVEELVTRVGQAYASGTALFWSQRARVRSSAILRRSR